MGNACSSGPCQNQVDQREIGVSSKPEYSSPKKDVNAGLSAMEEIIRLRTAEREAKEREEGNYHEDNSSSFSIKQGSTQKYTNSLDKTNTEKATPGVNLFPEEDLAASPMTFNNHSASHNNNNLSNHQPHPNHNQNHNQQQNQNPCVSRVAGLVCIETTDACVYEGEIDDRGRPTGKGVMEVRNGDRYTGEFLGGQFEGYGILVNKKEGMVYKGQWKANMRHGEGVEEYTDGKKYQGSFQNDLRDGYGKFSSSQALLCSLMGRPTSAT